MFLIRVQADPDIVTHWLSTGLSEAFFLFGSWGRALQPERTGH